MSAEHLLKQTSIIVSHHERIHRATGLNFNIFSISKIERLEVRTHSAMISELLDPNGSHGQGSIFLKKFIERTECLSTIRSGGSPVEFDVAKVSKEKYFSKGRVDIFIEFNNFILLIENKIDALDGDGQIQRYNEIASQIGKKYILLYLTKYGVDADKRSHGGSPYHKMSYSGDIIQWLESCIKEVALVPIVREGIFQYLNLVKKITGTTMASDLNDEILNLLLEGDNIKYAQHIANSICGAKGRILCEFFKKLQDKIKESSYTIVSNVENKCGVTIFDGNEKICEQWFYKGRQRIENVGIFVDVELADYFIHVEVATTALHCGIIRVTKGTTSDGAGQIRLNCDCKHDYERDREIVSLINCQIREWPKIKWCSVMINDDVYNNPEKLKDPEMIFKILKVIRVIINEFRKS